MSHASRAPRGRRSLPGLPARLRRRDGGYVMVMTALAVVPLLVLTAFAVDLGAWYAQSNKMQRMVDNAALAAVVWMPDHAKAQTAAQDVLAKNGYTGSFTITYPTEQRVRLTITQGTQQFFSNIVMRAPRLNRTATAEFSKAVPLGSPANTFGNALNASGNCTGGGAVCSGIWGSINGPWTGHNQGDPYTTRCTQTRNDFEPACSSTSNPEYKPGYVYAVDVPPSLVGQTVTVEVFDAIASNSSVTGEGIGTSQPFRTEFQLYRSDGSDLTVSTDDSLAMGAADCTAGPGGFVARSNVGADQSTFLGRWATLCRFTPTLSGIYPLYVKSSQIAGFQDQGSGSNSFAIRATRSGAGAQPSVYAINDMSIYSPTANSPGNESRFYLASINDEYAGKTMVVDLFDPGDGNSGTYVMQFRGPPSGLGTIPNDAGAVYPCRYNGTKSSAIGTGTLNQTSNTCQITTRTSSGSKYDNGWLRVKIDIPANYSCTTDCWWTVKYDYGSGTSTDRTVWTVTLLGDPVHLVE